MVHPPAPLLLPFPSEFTLFARNLAPSYRALPLGPLPPGRTSPRPLAFWRSANNPTTSSLANNARGKERRGIDRFGPKTVHDETTFSSSSSVCGDYLRFRFEFLSRLRGDGRGRLPSLLLTKIRQEGIPLCEDKSYECTENDLQASIKCVRGEVWTEI